MSRWIGGGKKNDISHMVEKVAAFINNPASELPPTSKIADSPKEIAPPVEARAEIKERVVLAKTANALVIKGNGEHQLLAEIYSELGWSRYNTQQITGSSKEQFHPDSESNFVSDDHNESSVIFTHGEYDYLLNSRSDFKNLEQNLVPYIKLIAPDVILFSFISGVGYETIPAARKASPKAGIIVIHHNSNLEDCGVYGYDGAMVEIYAITHLALADRIIVANQAEVDFLVERGVNPSRITIGGKNLAQEISSVFDLTLNFKSAEVHA